MEYSRNEFSFSETSSPSAENACAILMYDPPSKEWENEWENFYREALEMSANYSK